MKKYLACVIIAAMFLNGCGKAVNNAGRLINGESLGKPMDGIERVSRTEHSVVVHNEDNKESQDFEDANQSDEVRAKAIKATVEKMSDVKAASVVVNKDAAIIGVSFNGEPAERAIIKIKKQIEKLAMETDAGLDRAAVTATPELFERITRAESHKTGGPNLELNHVTPSF